MLPDVKRPQKSKETRKTRLLETIELVLDRGLDVEAEAEADIWASAVDASN